MFWYRKLIFLNIFTIPNGTKIRKYGITDHPEYLKIPVIPSLIKSKMLSKNKKYKEKIDF